MPLESSTEEMTLLPLLLKMLVCHCNPMRSQPRSLAKSHKKTTMILKMSRLRSTLMFMDGWTPQATLLQALIGLSKLLVHLHRYRHSLAPGALHGTPAPAPAP